MYKLICSSYKQTTNGLILIRDWNVLEYNSKSDIIKDLQKLFGIDVSDMEFPKSGISHVLTGRILKSKANPKAVIHCRIVSFNN